MKSESPAKYCCAGKAATPTRRRSRDPDFPQYEARTARAASEIASGHEDVAGFHLLRKFRPVCFHRVLLQLIHRRILVIRIDSVAFDRIAEFPDAAAHDAREIKAHRTPLSDSTISPATAAAVTVNGPPRYISAFMLPLRPLKLRVVAVMQTSPSDRNPTLGWHNAATGVINLRARLDELLDQPAFRHCRYTCCDAGEIDEAHAFRDFAPFDHARGDFDVLEAAIAHEPICAWLMRVPATSSTGPTLPNWCGLATTNGISSTLSTISFS